MPRTARVATGGYAHHVLNRGVGKMRLFAKKRDFEAFIGQAKERLPMRVLAWASCRRIGIDRGHPINRPDQPVARITWQQAMHFCEWLSQQTGNRFTLPTEAQWESACRAGTAGDFWYGGLDTDFGRFANLADRRLAPFAWRDSPPWHPRDDRFDDGALVTQSAGRYRPNPWGLHDMHGNVAEWTRTEYRPYPYNLRDGRDEPGGTGPKVVRGGSWYDRPKRARSSFRMNYEPWQPVYNVGFRVVMEVE